MALATQCPHCRTTFRVVPDQLKLRAGLVRCGACKQIFNGLENLLPPDEGTKPAPAVGAPATPQSVPVASLAPAVPQIPPEPQNEPSPSAASVSDDFRQPGEGKDDPLLRMTLMDFSEFERAAETRSAAPFQGNRLPE